MKEIVQIRISGVAGSGKTTLACKIGRLLKKHGIEVDVWEYDDSYDDNISEVQLQENMERLSKKVKVTIQTEQVKRHFV